MGGVNPSQTHPFITNSTIMRLSTGPPAHLITRSPHTSHPAPERLGLDSIGRPWTWIPWVNKPRVPPSPIRLAIWYPYTCLTVYHSKISLDLLSPIRLALPGCYLRLGGQFRCPYFPFSAKTGSVLLLLGSGLSHIFCSRKCDNVSLVSKFHMLLSHTVSY